MTKKNTAASATEVKTMKFDAEITRLLDIVIHSLYTNKDIFLRELVSNASDACDKLRYLSVQDDSLTSSDDKELRIEVSCDKEKGIVTVKDNGIGMSEGDMKINLGTIAHSGTRKFFSQLKEGDASAKNNDLIGNFGVGFYSAFMIADKVEVISKKAGTNESFLWQSEGNGEFSIQSLSSIDDAVNLDRITSEDGKFVKGTIVILHVKKEYEEYLDKFKLEFILDKYSGHILFPIDLISFDDKDEKQVKAVNEDGALWLKDKKDVTDEEYKKFYKSLSYMPDEPFAIFHNKVEGVVEYTNLLFLPSMKPFDLFNPDRTTRVKLYAKRVFITENDVEIIPKYLRFVRGVIDSPDLPLNISRETLQDSSILRKISSSVTKKILSELKSKAEKEKDEYLKFWDNFGPVLREGLCEGNTDKELILDVCYFKTSDSKGEYKLLGDYVNKMLENKEQKEIYYICGNSIEELENNPRLEAFKKAGIEVLFFTDTVDDFWVNVVSGYKGHAFKSITRNDKDTEELLDKLLKDSKSDDSKDKKDDQKKEEKVSSDDEKALVECFTAALDKKVERVEVTHKLSTSFASLSVGEHGMDIRMEKFLLNQKQIPTKALKILEINPEHQLNRYILESYKKSDRVVTEEITNLVTLVFESTCISQGEDLENPSLFSKRIGNIFTQFINE